MIVRPEDSSISSRLLTVVGILLVIFNILLFIFVNSRPILQQQDEITFHKIFWSMDGIHTYTLHSGLRAIDFKKLFAARPIDGEFRTRQFSYFLEMLSFKLWQYWQVASFRSYTLILIHILNVILLWQLVFHLTQNKWTAHISAILFLNSGISLLTLLFPFRNAKLLVMTLFLIGWLVIIRSKGKFVETSNLRFLTFFLILTLSFFTDEYAVFLNLFLLVMIVLRDGSSGLFNRRMTIGIFSATMTCVVLSYCFLTLARKIDLSVSLWVQQAHLLSLVGYILDKSVIFDTFRAFFGYFFPRNFGWWDLSLGSMVAMAASFVIFFLILKNRHPRAALRLVIAITLTIIIKTILLPHNRGVHAGVMPHGTIFPSLLFFDHYYAYCEVLLCNILLVALLDRVIVNNRIFILLLFLVSLINTSNAIYATSALAKVNNLEQQGGENITSQILSVKNKLNRLKAPIYLSFPSGNSALYKSDLGEIDPSSYHASLNPNFVKYNTLIPEMYLHSIEEDRILISLENAKPKKPFRSNHELVNAHLFLDIPSNKIYDLAVIKKVYGFKKLIPQIITNAVTEKELSLFTEESKEKTAHVIFFIKGGAEITLRTTGTFKKEEHAQQTYGQSYQMFHFVIDRKNHDSLQTIKLIVSPINDQSINFVGPFLFANTFNDLEIN